MHAYTDLPSAAPMSVALRRPEVAAATSGADVLYLPGVRRPAREAVTRPDDGDPAVLELTLIGQFQLLEGGRPLAVGATGQRLLALLACCGRQATRTRVAQQLWPDVTDARSHANLRTAIYRLQRRLPDVVVVSKTHVALHPDIVVDVDVSTRLAEQLLRGDGDARTVTATLAANLYDDLLPGWTDEWLSDLQFTYRQLRLNTLEALAGRLTVAGRHSLAVQAALAAVQADRLRETAHEALIRAWVAQGNRNDAIAHYRSYRRAMRDELGLDPSTSLDQLLWSAA